MSKRIVLLSGSGLLLVLGLAAFFVIGHHKKLFGQDALVQSPYFLMNESTANEMSMDGGTANVPPHSEEAKILSGKMTAADAANSPAVETKD